VREKRAYALVGAGGMTRLLLPLLLASTVVAAAPSLILHHGRIMTVDAQFREVQAMAVEQGRITALGTDADVMALRGAETEIIDLGGAMLLPGLMDSHVHPTSAAVFEFDHTIPDIPDIPALLSYIRSRAAALPEGALIYVRQVFITRLREQRYPKRKELDEAAPRHPVHFSTGPDSMLNSMALKMAGIDRDFRVPKDTAGAVEKDAKGEPTGLLRTLSPKFKGLGKSTARTPTAEQKMELLKTLFTDYNRVGFTTVADRGASADAVAMYAALRDKGELTIRMRCSHTFPTGSLWPAVEKALDDIISSPYTRPDPMLQIIGTKIWLDGGMLTGSALMQQPWGVSSIYGITDPEYRGIQLVPTAQLKKMVRKVAAAGLQFTAHSVGDGAVQTLLETYAEVEKELPAMRETRPCVTHCNFMTPESIQLAAKLGVVIDLQPIWFHLDGHTLLKQFGQERTARFQPLSQMVKAGIPVGGGSDHMQKIGSLRAINAYNPWLGMWIAVSRQCRFLAEPLHSESALSREQALRMYTLENAKVLLMEKDCGSLELGKRADFIQVDRDILHCPLSELKDTQVLRTWLAGVRVFQREGQ
jgi:predicted amidohydrolase YtcJ